MMSHQARRGVCRQSPGSGISSSATIPRGASRCGGLVVKGGPTRCGGQAHPRLHYAEIGRQRQGRGAPSATVAADYL